MTDTDEAVFDRMDAVIDELQQQFGTPPPPPGGRKSTDGRPHPTTPEQIGDLYAQAHKLAMRGDHRAANELYDKARKALGIASY